MGVERGYGRHDAGGGLSSQGWTLKPRVDSQAKGGLSSQGWTLKPRVVSQERHLEAAALGPRCSLGPRVRTYRPQQRLSLVRILGGALRKGGGAEGHGAPTAACSARDGAERLGRQLERQQHGVIAGYIGPRTTGRCRPCQLHGVGARLPIFAVALRALE